MQLMETEKEESIGAQSRAEERRGKERKGEERSEKPF